MAIYHLSAKIVGRSAGRSAVAAAAYRAAERLEDERQGRVCDYRAKSGVVHAEILLPSAAGEKNGEWRDRERLWNAVERVEKRKDAQVAREVEIALPRELSRPDRIALAQDFVRAEFVGRGMVADLTVHEPKAADGKIQPHAHVLLTTRELGPDGFGPKVREWNAKPALEAWRERWAEAVNQALARQDVRDQQGEPVRVDHRSLEAQQTEALATGNLERAALAAREPEPKIGPRVAALEAGGLRTDRMAEVVEIREARAERSQEVAAIAAERRGVVIEIREAAARLVERGRERLAELGQRLEQTFGAFCYL